MIRAEEALAREETILERHPVVSQVLDEAVAAGRVEIDGVIARSDAAGRDVRVEETLAAVRERVLTRYRTRVAAEFSADEISTWRAAAGQVGDALAAAASPTGVPGALRLVYALEGVPSESCAAGSLDGMLAEAQGACVCGYAQTRQLPKRLCPACSDVILIAWAAEERRLLGASPEWMHAVDSRIDEAVEELARLSLRPEEGLSDTVRIVRRRTGRALARISKAHRGQSAALDLTTWSGFAEAITRSVYVEAAGGARRHRRWGLGTARLATLGLAGSPEIAARMKEIARRTDDRSRRS